MIYKDCVICHKKIKKKDNYLKVDLFLKGKKRGTDYAHQSCWKGTNNVNRDLNELVSGIFSYAVKNGIVPERKVVIT